MIDDRFRDPRGPDAEPELPSFERAEYVPPPSQYIEESDRVRRELDRGREKETIPDDPYVALPLAVRMRYNRAEYLWLSDVEKATLVQRECEPDC